MVGIMEIKIDDKDRAIVMKPGVHKVHDYVLSSKEKSDDGTLTIVLKPRDMKEIKRKLNKLVNTLAVKLNEPDSKVVKGILKDKLSEFWDEDVEELYNKVVVENQSVKAKEGCFKIIIGDQRRKNSDAIMLRD